MLKHLLYHPKVHWAMGVFPSRRTFIKQHEYVKMETFFSALVSSYEQFGLPHLEVMFFKFLTSIPLLEHKAFRAL